MQKKKWMRNMQSEKIIQRGKIYLRLKLIFGAKKYDTRCKFYSFLVPKNYKKEYFLNP